MLKSLGEHYYPDNKTIYEVSFDAKEEMEKNWIEFTGYAAGEASVNHPDWFSLYETMLASCPKPDTHKPDQWPTSYLVHTKTPDGAIAHIGTLTHYPAGWNKNEGRRIKLEG